MSTGADCTFKETEKYKWFYKLQKWPYGETYDYDKYGPFPHYGDAVKHLQANHANPGGWSIDAQPGCEHPEHLREKRHGGGWECWHCGWLQEPEE